MAKRPLHPRVAEEVKVRIQTTQLVKLLQDHAAGKLGDIEPTRIQAAKILLDRSLPTLSAVEQTHIDPEESLTEQQLMDRLLALIDAHPDLVQRALAARARQQTGVTLGVTQDDAIKKVG